jgi:F0F1-type ATP synthase alpha subunit
VLVIFAVTEGYMDDVGPSDIPKFESDLREYARSNQGAVLSAIADTGDLDEDGLIATITAFKDIWSPDFATSTQEFEIDLDEHAEAEAMRAVHDDNVVEEA